MNEIRYTISDFKSVGTAWGQLDSATQVLWRNAANKAWEYNRGYRLFTADYIYRLIAGLSVPGSPSDYHQLFGLKVKNSSVFVPVYFYRDDKDVVGPITISTDFKKTELAPASGQPFYLWLEGWYLTEGGIGHEIDGWDFYYSDIDWTNFERSFLTSDRQYFHLRVGFSLSWYNAEVYFNNIIMSDKNGEFYNENFITERNTPWVPSRLYRKKDWYFFPSFIAPYYEHIYLQD